MSRQGSLDDSLTVGDRVLVIAKGPFQCRQGVVKQIYEDGVVAVLLDGDDDEFSCWLSEVARVG